MTDQNTFDAIIIGAGPAGSTLGGILAKEGINGAIIERERFPRFQIGESLLPATVNIFDRLGIHDQVKATCVSKPGGKWYYGDKAIEGLFSFTDNKASFKKHPHAYMVERAKFDKILLDNCIKLGANVMQETRVEDVIMDADRAVGVTIRDKDGKQSDLHANMIFDCSGRNAIIGNKVAGRKPNTLKRMATFAHYEGTAIDSDVRSGWFVGQMIHNGWVWLIPLSENKISVGVVCEVDEYKRITTNPEAFLDAIVGSNQLLKRGLSEDARRTTKVRVTGNVGFTSENFRGEGWALVGDAAFFIDPCYSSGVHLAMETAELAADQFLKCKEANNYAASQYDGYQSKLKKHEKIVQQMVDSFYLGTTNSFVRATTLLSAKSNWATRKFTTFVGGDFGVNTWFISMIEKASTLTDKLGLGRSKKKRLPTVSDLVEDTLDASSTPIESAA